MTGQVKKKRKRTRSLPGKDTTPTTRPGRGTGDTGTATKDHTELTQSTPSKPPSTEVPDPLLAKPRTEAQIPLVVKEAPKTLDKLYMDTGSLATILPENGWSDIAAKLKTVYTKGKGPKDEVLAELCTIYYKGGKKGVRTLPSGKATDQIPNLVEFLEKFMEANGQWAYIKKQDWFNRDDCAIAIDVNYYANRAGSGELPSFHKDTGGNNIFVNLVFDNEADIEATEWFADVARPSPARQKWQESLLPTDYLDDLTRARQALWVELGETRDTSTVTGGISKGKQAYVSWVDDLIWHATPTDKPRIVYTHKDALRSYIPLDRAVDGYFTYKDKLLGDNISGFEVIATMAEAPGPNLKAWLARKKLEPQDIDPDVARTAWKELYGGGSNEAKTRYFHDTQARAVSQWRLTGGYSEAVAKDKRLKDSSIIYESPVGLSKRRRFNSLPENQKALAAVRAANKNKGRSFLRTWVRILLPKVTISGVDFQ